jgi:methionine-rich copper-binding protein CopC
MSASICPLAFNIERDIPHRILALPSPVQDGIVFVCHAGWNSYLSCVVAGLAEPLNVLLSPTRFESSVTGLDMNASASESERMLWSSSSAAGRKLPHLIREPERADHSSLAGELAKNRLRRGGLVVLALLAVLAACPPAWADWYGLPAWDETGVRWTQVAVKNLNPSAETVTFRFHSKSGAVLATTSASLDPGATESVLTAAALGLAGTAGMDGYVTIAGTTPATEKRLLPSGAIFYPSSEAGFSLGWRWQKAGPDSSNPPSVFSVTTVVPADGALLKVSPTEIALDFNAAVNPSSVDAADLLLDAVPATGVTVVDGDTLSFTVLAPDDGAHSVTVAAGALTNLDGVGVAPFTSAFTVDTQAPTVTVDPLTTADSSPPLTGTVDDATATVRVTVDGQTYTAINHGDGTWLLPDDTVDPPLTIGVYNVAAEATDAAGNVGHDATVDELTVEVFSVTTVAPADGALLKVSPTEITLDFNAAVNPSSVDATDLLLDAVPATGVTVVDGDTLSFTVPAPADGAHSVTVAAGALTSADGVGVAPFTSAFTVDTQAPTVTVDPLTTADSSPPLTGTVDDATATVRVTVDGQTYTAINHGDGTWLLPDDTITPPLTGGVYDVAAEATDAAGNVGHDATVDELTVS